MNFIIVKLIALIHILLLIFVCAAPFTDSNYFIMLHTIMIPFIIVHWVCNDATCVLTLIEKKIRGILDVPLEDCITCKLVNPVYEIPNNYKDYSTYIYTIAISLLLISIGHFITQYRTGKITNYLDLFKI